MTEHFITTETAHEQRMYEHYQQLERQNYELRAELRRTKKAAKSWRMRYSELAKQRREENKQRNRKPKFRNNGKAGK